jgi:hypothetical protein
MNAILRTSCALAGALLVVVSSATAAPILITRDFAGGPPPPSDCAGVFGGQRGTPCDVGFGLTPAVEVSPIIFKANFQDGALGETQSYFDSVTGGEFNINGQPLASGNPGTSGTWSYTPGLNDPAVRFWVAKGGNEGFKLHWMVEGTTVGNTCSGDAYNLACLNLALAVTSGTWNTLGQGLSHMTWYDTGDVPNVPEPVTLALFGTGVLGLGIARRRRAR